MNSEISNVPKLSPVTVVKTDKPAVERSLTGAKPDTSVRDSVLTVALNELSVSNANQQQGESSKTKSKPSSDLLRKAADQGNSLLQVVNRNLQFKVDESTNELVVKIVDSQSGELVRQIPSEEMLAFIKRMQDLEGQQGSMIQDRA